MIASYNCCAIKNSFVFEQRFWETYFWVLLQCLNFLIYFIRKI